MVVIEINTAIVAKIKEMEPILVYITSPMNSFAHMVRSLFPMSVDM
jgi:hypothetical protein